MQRPCRKAHNSCGRITLRPYNRSVDWNSQVGDALLGANCGFSTLNLYGGWEAVRTQRDASGAKGARPMRATSG